MNNNLLKFRVWDGKIFTYTTGNITGFVSGPLTNGLFLNFVGETRPNPDVWGESIKVSQFIGIQDKNGIDLFSGDIINFEIPGISHGPEREYIKNAEIFYSPEDCMWCFGKFKMNDGQDYWYSFADNIDRKSIEKVGCIYGENK